MIAALRHRARTWFDADTDRGRYTKAVVVGGLVAALLAGMVLGTLSDRRTQANYFDVQARALLDGNWEVPPEVLVQEAILHDGEAYLYWPPGPSFLRLPLFLVTDRFDGRLTPLMITVAWSTFTVLFALVIWRLRRMLRGRAPLGRLEPAAYALLLVAACGGSLILYLVAVPWVYHESILWGLAMALGACHALLGFLERPGTRRAVVTGLFVLGALLTRAPAGYAGALAMLITAAWIAFGVRGDRNRGQWLPLALAAAVPLLISSGINWMKFDSLNTYPMADQVHSRTSVFRQEALAANGGDLFGIDLVPSTLWNYLRPDGIRFTSTFPFVDAPADLPDVVGGAFFDTLNRTPSVVSFMPFLAVLAVWGGVLALIGPRGSPLRWSRPVLFGAAAVPAASLWIAGITPRFATEFLPLLCVGSAIGAIDVTRRLQRRSARDRGLLFGGLALLAVFGIGANVAYGMTTRATAGSGHDLDDHVSRQLWVADRLGGDLDVVASVSLPPYARPDQIRVIGDCAATYYSSGEHGHTTRPWLDVDIRPLRFEIRRSAVDLTPDQQVPVAEFLGLHRIVLSLETTQDGYRLALAGGGTEGTTADVDVGPGEAVEVEVDTRQPFFYAVEVDGERVLDVPKEDNDGLYQSAPNVLHPALPTATQTAPLGMTVTEVPTPASELCERLLEEVDRSEEADP